MGRLDEAREIVERLRAMTAVVMPDASFYLRKAEHRELLLSGMRLAIGEIVTAIGSLAAITIRLTERSRG